MDDAFSCLGLIEASRQGILNHLVSIIFLNECIIFILHGIASHKIKVKKNIPANKAKHCSFGLTH